MTTITYARRVNPRRQDAGTVHAVIARRPKADVAIQESAGALRSLDRHIAALLAMTPNVRR